jgi:hypothetical protein
MPLQIVQSQLDYYSILFFVCILYNRGRYGECERGTKHEAQCSFAQAFRVDNSVVAQLERCGGMASLNVVRYFLAESHWENSHIRADSMKSVSSPLCAFSPARTRSALTPTHTLVCPYIRYQSLFVTAICLPSSTFTSPRPQ